MDYYERQRPEGSPSDPWELIVGPLMGELGLRRAGILHTDTEDSGHLSKALGVLDSVSQAADGNIAGSISVPRAEVGVAVRSLQKYYRARTPAQAVARAIEERDLPVTPDAPARRDLYVGTTYTSVIDSLVNGAANSVEMANYLGLTVPMAAHKYDLTCNALQISPDNPIALVRRAYELNVRQSPQEKLLFHMGTEGPGRLEYHQFQVITDRSQGISSNATGPLVNSHKYHLKLAREKLHAKNTTEAIAKAITLDLLKVEINDTAPPPALPRQQFKTLALAAQGFTNQGISEQMNISEDTVKAQMRIGFHKLGVHSREESVRRLFEVGLFVPFHAVIDSIAKAKERQYVDQIG
jgi:DNA-binding CsgD family transcriptional regulator